MKSVAILTLTSLAGFASAQAAPAPDFGPAFAIDGYRSGCSPGGCITSFNLTYNLPLVEPPPKGYEPPFVARCAVVSSRVTEEWTDCELLQGGGETLASPHPVTGTGTLWVRARSLQSGVYGDRLTTVRHGYWDQVNGLQRNWTVEGAGGINTQRTSMGAEFLVGVVRFA